MIPKRIAMIRWQEALQEFIAERCDLSPVTIDVYRQTLSRFFAGHKNLLAVKRLQIVQFLNKYDKVIAYNNNLSVIRSFYAWASEYYQIENPSRQLRNKRVRTLPNVRVVSSEEYQVLLANEGHDRDIAVFLANTGIRAAEFIGLRPSHIFDTYFDVMGKGAKPRRIPLNKTAKAILDRYDNLINFRKNRYIDRYVLKRKLDSLSTRLKLKHINPHSLRHFFATALIEKGANIADVSKLLGHSNVNITISRYYHPTDLDSAVGLLDD